MRHHHPHKRRRKIDFSLSLIYSSDNNNNNNNPPTSLSPLKPFRASEPHKPISLPPTPPCSPLSAPTQPRSSNSPHSHHQPAPTILSTHAVRLGVCASYCRLRRGRLRGRLWLGLWWVRVRVDFGRFMGEEGDVSGWLAAMFLKED